MEGNLAPKTEYVIYWPQPIEALREFQQEIGAKRGLPEHWVKWCEPQVVEPEHNKEIKDILTCVYCVALGLFVGMGFSATLGWCYRLPI